MPDKIVTDAFPLSPMQQGMLFHSLYAAGRGVDIEQLVITRPEAPAAPAMERAWQWAAARHAILRTALRWEGVDRPRQEVLASVPVEFSAHDWRGAKAAA